MSSCLEGVGRGLRVGLTIFWTEESEARDVDADSEAVERDDAEGWIGGRLGEGTGAEDTLPFAPTVVQTLLLLDGSGDVTES